MLATFYHLDMVASNYGDGAYGSSTYNGTTTTNPGGGGSTGTGAPGNAGSGSLSNTGVIVGLIVGVAALTLLVAMIVRIWRRPNRVVVESIESEAEYPSETGQSNQ